MKKSTTPPEIGKPLLKRRHVQNLVVACVLPHVRPADRHIARAHRYDGRPAAHWLLPPTGFAHWGLPSSWRVALPNPVTTEISGDQILDRGQVEMQAISEAN